MSNPVAVSPWYDTLQQFRRKIFADLKVCLPGTIAEVNDDGTVNVNIGVLQNISQPLLPSGLNFAYPQLLECPVFTLQGGGVGAVMPISVGDGCLVIFADRCISTWFTTGQANPLPDLRMHDISNGFVLVGVNPDLVSTELNTPLGADEGGVCETKNATGAKVAVNSNTHLITIANSTGTLLAALHTLITALSTLTVNTGTGVITPTSVTAINVALTELQALMY